MFSFVCFVNMNLCIASYFPFHCHSVYTVCLNFSASNFLGTNLIKSFLPKQITLLGLIQLFHLPKLFSRERKKRNSSWLVFKITRCTLQISVLLLHQSYALGNM